MNQFIANIKTNSTNHLKKKSDIRCPNCFSGAFNRYGKTKNGKQRYKCLACERQFVFPRKRQLPDIRPSCPVCGKLMHVYHQSRKIIRFRCSDYPECHTYVPVLKREI